jgi:hypothetical protein
MPSSLWAIKVRRAIHSHVSRCNNNLKRIYKIMKLAFDQREEIAPNGLPAPEPHGHAWLSGPFDPFSLIWNSKSSRAPPNIEFEYTFRS